MSAIFGVWPPATNTRLVGRFAFADDGTLVKSSKNPDGLPFVASITRNSAGNYTVVLSGNLFPAFLIPAGDQPGLALTHAGTTARIVGGGMSAANTLLLVGFDAAGAAADAAMYCEVYFT